MPVLLNNARRARKKRIKGIPVKPSKSSEMLYFRRLNDLADGLKNRTDLITQLIREDVPRADVVRQVRNQLETSEREFKVAAGSIVKDWAGNVSEINKRRIESTLKRALGADTAKLLESGAIRDKLDEAMEINIGLIKTVPNDHFADISKAIMDAYRGEEFKEGSLIARLVAIDKKLGGRAHFIARDQTSNLVSDLNQIRQQEAGIERYIWRHSDDNRVVGKPGGLYPKGSKLHMNHWVREGDIYFWNDPPADGHPGKPIGCRCFPEPIIDREKLSAIHV
jgi:uncharacterized protein with gpF-like domain